MGKNNILPISRHILGMIPTDCDIVATSKSTGPRMIVHNNTIVGQYMSDGKINWIDSPETENAKKIVNSPYIENFN